MVTTTAPSPFLARVSAGTEDTRRFPTSLFQRLMRLDYNSSNESHQSGCCPVGSGSSARPALKRTRRRKEKIRSAPSSLLQNRYQYQQYRAGLGRKNAGQGTRNCYEVPAGSLEPGLEASAPGEEAPAASARPNAVVVSKPFRKELFKNRMGKSEKVPLPCNQPVHSIHLCDQSKTSRQRSKYNISLNKFSSTKKCENKFWHESLSSELIKKQEKKPLKNPEKLKTKNSIFLAEVNQKENYAGAKFSDPPSPSVLPKPPSHWVGSTVEYSDQSRKMMAVHLKTLLKVHA